jgi:hypothetical protein
MINNIKTIVYHRTLYKGTNFILHFQGNLENYLDGLTHPYY